MKLHQCRMREIRWTLKVVQGHLSFRLCLGLNELFPSMFHDSAIAKSFRLSKIKCAYLITHGMYPYLQGQLLQEINISPFFTVSFDESLNLVVQKQQMDVVIKYWCTSSKCVKSRYLDSRFDYSGSAENSSSALLETIKPLTEDKMIHLSMDGPNVNWCVLSTLKARREEREIPPLWLAFSVGCFQGWSERELEAIFRELWKLFDKSPARRVDYIKGQSSETPKFPLKILSQKMGRKCAGCKSSNGSVARFCNAH